MTTPSKAEKKSPTRYSFEDNCAGCCGCEVVIAENGEYVEFEEFESLEAELAVTRRALELAVKDVNDHLQENRAPGVLSAEDYLISARKEIGQ